MRAVIQRVSRASVSVEGRIVGQIQKGLMVLIGAAEDDTDHDVQFMIKKVATLRIFRVECTLNIEMPRMCQHLILLVMIIISESIDLVLKA